MKREIPGQLHLPFNSNETKPDLKNSTSSSFQDFSKNQKIINSDIDNSFTESVDLTGEEIEDQGWSTDLEKRKEEVLGQYDIPENLQNMIHFNEDEFSPKDLKMGCYIGNQSLYDYLEGEEIEAELKKYRIPKERHKDVDPHKLTIDGLSLEEYRAKADQEAEAYKKRIEKTRQKLPKIVAKHLGWWQNYDNY